MKGDAIYNLLRGTPAFDDLEWAKIKPAVDDLPDMEFAAYFGTDEKVAFAALDGPGRAVFLFELERGAAAASISRWPIPDTCAVNTKVHQRRRGDNGPVRDRSWHFDFTHGRELWFESLEQNPNEFESRLQLNELFARELCRLLGWAIPA